MRSLTLLLTAVLLLGVAPVRADGTGGDAPATPSLAADLAPGTYAGRIGDGNDTHDWYRVPHPAGKGVQVDIVIDNVGHYAAVLVTDAGAFRDQAYLTPGYANNTTAVSARLAGSGGAAVRVGIGEFDPFARVPANYTLTVAIVDLPDFVVSGLRVERVSAVDVGPAHVYGTQRRVEVDVTNVGAAAGSGWLSVRASVTLGSSSIGFASPSLAPGATQTFSFDWDTTGMAGDVTVSAFAQARHDRVVENGHASIQHAVLVGGAGVGVSAMGPHVVCVTASLCASGGVGVFPAYLGGGAFTGNTLTYVYSYNGTSYASAWTPYAVGLVATHPTDQGHSAYVCVGGPVPFQCTVLLLP